jgi:hypothetical protein
MMPRPRGGIRVKLSLAVFLLAMSVPAFAGPGVSPEQVYIDCVARQTVRFSPSGKPFEAVLQAANLACNREAASMQVVTPELANISRELATRFAFLTFMKSRAHLPGACQAARRANAPASACANPASAYARCASQK